MAAQDAYLDDIFDTLRSTERRYAISYVAADEQGFATVGEIAKSFVEADEYGHNPQAWSEDRLYDEVKRTTVKLEQVLPKVRNVGLDYDERSSTVSARTWTGDRREITADYLEAAADRDPATVDTAFDILSERERRDVLSYLYHDDDGLATRDEIVEKTGHELVSLHHSHFPMLAENEMISYEENPDTGTYEIELLLDRDDPLDDFLVTALERAEQYGG